MACGNPNDSQGDLVITGAATPNPAAGGGQVTYAVNVANDSTVTTTVVLVTIQLPQRNLAPALVKRSAGVKGQVCSQSGGTIATTYKTVKAHTTVKVSVTLALPLVPVATTFALTARAHADNAIGGMEPGDGNGTIAGVALPETIPVVLLPSLRAATLSCGDDVSATFFQPGETTVQFTASLGCARLPFAVRMSCTWGLTREPARRGECLRMDVPSIRAFIPSTFSALGHPAVLARGTVRSRTWR